jgi:uncharacterized protein (TIGR02001 family)
LQRLHSFLLLTLHLHLISRLHAVLDFFSQYIFRGLTQTDRKPALQGGFDVNHTSGLISGGWASNVSWLRDNAGSILATDSLQIWG